MKLKVVAAFVLGAGLAAGATYLLVEDGVDPVADTRSPRPNATPTEPTGSPSPTTTPTPSPTPTPDDRFTGLEDDDPLRLDGIGGVVVGMTVEQAEQVTGHQIRVSSDFTDACRYAQPVGGPRHLSFMVSYGRIVRVDVGRGSPIETLSGIGIGAPEEEVLGTYPDQIEVQPHPYLMDRGSYLVFHPRQDTELLLIFETDRGKVTSFRSGFAEQVRYIEGCA